MLKKHALSIAEGSTSFVLGALGGPTYRTEYAGPSLPRLLRPRWTVFLTILRAVLMPSPISYSAVSPRCQIVFQQPAKFRAEPTTWPKLSNGKRKGQGNTKNGNTYLAWAFVEAAHLAVRYYPQVQCFHHRKQAKTNAIVAIKAVAHKLARACYDVMRDQVPFDPQKAFAS